MENTEEALKINDEVVDNIVEIKTKQTTITKVKNPKIININVDEDFIENNLIDMPFIYYYKSKTPIFAVKYNWCSNDGRSRSIEVRSSKLGIPSPYEYKVLLALFRLHMRNNGDKLIYSEAEGKYLISDKIVFSFRELAKEMGYKNFGGSIKGKLDKAIECLNDTNIYNTANGGLYDPITKKYILDGKKSVSIIHSYQAYNYIEGKDGGLILDKKSIKDKASVTIGDFFLKNLCHGKGKISDKKMRLSLKMDLAERLYVILNKWRNNRSQMYLTFEKLYERIPLDDTKTVSYRNKRIVKATEELLEKGYLIEFVRDKKGITFVFKKRKKESASDDTAKKESLLLKYVSYGELMEGLSKFGLSNEEIEKNFKLYQTPYVQGLLRYVDDNLYRIKDTRKYILKGLTKEYTDIPKEYFDIM